MGASLFDLVIPSARRVVMRRVKVVPRKSPVVSQETLDRVRAALARSPISNATADEIKKLEPKGATALIGLKPKLGPLRRKR